MAAAVFSPAINNFMLYHQQTDTSTMRIVLLVTVFLLSLTNLSAQADTAKLKITPLTGDFYIYTTYNTYQQSQVPANGMYLVTNKGVVMFDTPWDTSKNFLYR